MELKGTASMLLCLILRISDASVLPNIVFVLADDLGWNDVSFHGSNNFLTPNIDALAYSGLILQDYYTQPICTPARSALLTGRHPIHNGMEHDVIYASQPWGLPLSERILPQYLKPLGYDAQAVGKWHLGFFKSCYTPTRRGFDSHYGTWLGHQDHFNHYKESVPMSGYDFHRGLNVSWEAENKYAADLFTEEAETIIRNHDEAKPLFLYVAHISPHAPLQAPQKVIDRFKYISDKKRQTFAAMVTKVDESVGRITQALKNKNMLDNTIIIFLSDNGGATHGFNGNVASNWPLRGGKQTLWEGGVRAVGLIWSPLIQAAPRVHHGLVNVQDWLPTLLSAIGASDQTPEDLDGVSQWAALNNHAPPPYTKMLHNIDPVDKISALRFGQWKIIKGRTFNGTYDGWYGKLNDFVPYDVETVRGSMAGQAIQTSPRHLPDSSILLQIRAEATISCNPTRVPHVIKIRSSEENTPLGNFRGDPECQPHLAPCLFNVEQDPCEFVNLASMYPTKVKQLLTLLDTYASSLVPPNNKPGDPISNPVRWNNTWVPWKDYEE